jgi:hypothetical protein
VGLAEAAGDGEAALGLGLGLAVLLPSPPQPPIEKASSPIVAKYKSLCIADRPQMLNFKISNKALQLQPVVVLSLSVFDVMRSLKNCQVFLMIEIGIFGRSVFGSRLGYQWQSWFDILN